jgi:hypothetical protein
MLLGMYIQFHRRSLSVNLSWLLLGLTRPNPAAEVLDFLAVSRTLSLLAATWEHESTIVGDIFYHGNVRTISAFAAKDGQR